MPDGTADQVETKGPVSLQEIDANQPPVVATQPDQTQPPASAVPAPAPVPAASAPSPESVQAEKHGIIGKLVGGFKDSGSGTSASQFWRSLIGGALVGMGAADNPGPIHGPYGDIPGGTPLGQAGRAYAAKQEQQQKQAQIEKQDKQRQFENQLQMDDLTLKKAADARAQIQSINNSLEHEKLMQVHDLAIKNGNWELADKAAKRALEQANTFNDLEEHGAQSLRGSDGEALEFKDHMAAEKASHDNPNFFMDKGQWKTQTIYNTDTGKYRVYRVPDTDIKNVQLKDHQGNVQTIKRMPLAQYMQYRQTQQNIDKGALEITKITEELGDMRRKRQAEKAFEDWDTHTDADGNVDLTTLSPGTRTALAAKAPALERDAFRVRAAAEQRHTQALNAGDKESADAAMEDLEEAKKQIDYFGGITTRIHGGKVQPVQKQALDSDTYDKVLNTAAGVDYNTAVKNIQADPRIPDTDKKRLVKDLDKKRLENVAPYMTMLQDANGKTINVSNGDVPNWTAKGYTVIGQGTGAAAAPSNEVEREK